MAAGQIVIDLLMKTGSFETNTKKASNSLNKLKKDVIEVGKTLAAIGATAAVAGAGIAVAWTKSVAETGKEIDRLSTLSNTSAESFQKLAYAAQTVGIEQEKLSDIYKDMQDRVGDFMSTGGGPMKDFFEQIAPLVGVTADQFARLSGPEALQLYYDSLQKAGVSQSQMIFYMEAMASDSALLAPLLADNGREMKRLGDEASRLGGVMNNETVQAAKELDNNLNQLNSMFSGLSIAIANEVLPVVNDFISGMMDSSTETDGLYSSAKDLAGDTELKSWIEGIARTLAFLADMAVKAAQAIRAVASSASVVGADIGYALGAIKLTGDSIFNPEKADEIAAAWQKMGKMRDEVGESANNAWGALFSDPFYLSNQLDKAFSNSKKPIDPVSATLANVNEWGMVPTTLPAITASGGGGRKKSGSGSKSDPAGDYINQLNEQIALIGKQTEYEKALANIQLGKYGALSQYQKDEILGYAQTLDFMREQQEETQRYSEFIEQITGADRVKKHTEEIGFLQKAWQDGLITQEQYITNFDLLNQKMVEVNGGYWEQYLETARESLMSFDDLAKSVIDNFTSRFGDAFESAIFDSENLSDAMQNLGSSMLRSVVNALGQMAAQWLAYQAVQLLVGKTSSAASIAMAAATGTAMAAAYAPAAAMASLASFGANSAPAMAGIASAVSLAQGLSLVGMAHDGIDSVPQTGTWLLEKGERVMTSQTSARLDSLLERIDAQQRAGRSSQPANAPAPGKGMTINLIENPERAGEVVERRDENGNDEADVFVADIFGDGKRARAIQQVFGLARVGR